MQGVIDLKQTGGERLQDKLGLLRGFLSPKANLRGATDILVERIQMRFLRKVDRWNRPWVASASGRARAAKMGYPYGTLYRTGAMYEGLGVKYTGEYTWRVGFNKDGRSPYAAKYADQSRIGASKEPIYRDFLGYNNQDVKLVEAYLTKRLSDALRKL